eukprot:TRINITY_DN43735_c0_g1_i1.p1 TRINITY_DN43735_c0_g1~~TRINITY_DN43735_c0_g1_i1.p1  ORF type:complete len:778 (+),score=138.51 TRINITY_DN43735_c0_g1_i1:118-2451(+)
MPARGRSKPPGEDVTSAAPFPETRRAVRRTTERRPSRKTGPNAGYLAPSPPLTQALLRRLSCREARDILEGNRPCAALNQAPSHRQKLLVAALKGSQDTVKRYHIVEYWKKVTRERQQLEAPPRQLERRAEKTKTKLADALETLAKLQSDTWDDLDDEDDEEIGGTPVVTVFREIKKLSEDMGTKLGGLGDKYAQQLSDLANLSSNMNDSIAQATDVVSRLRTHLQDLLSQLEHEVVPEESKRYKKGRIGKGLKSCLESLKQVEEGLANDPVDFVRQEVHCHHLGRGFDAPGRTFKGGVPSSNFYTQLGGSEGCVTTDTDDDALLLDNELAAMDAVHKESIKLHASVSQELGQIWGDASIIGESIRQVSTTDGGTARSTTSLGTFDELDIGATSSAGGTLPPSHQGSRPGSKALLQVDIREKLGEDAADVVEGLLAELDSAHPMGLQAEAGTPLNCVMESPSGGSLSSVGRGRQSSSETEDEMMRRHSTRSSKRAGSLQRAAKRFGSFCSEALEAPVSAAARFGAELKSLVSNGLRKSSQLANLGAARTMLGGRNGSHIRPVLDGWSPVEVDPASSVDVALPVAQKQASGSSDGQPKLQKWRPDSPPSPGGWAGDTTPPPESDPMSPQAGSSSCSSRWPGSVGRFTASRMLGNFAGSSRLRDSTSASAQASRRPSPSPSRQPNSEKQASASSMQPASKREPSIDRHFFGALPTSARSPTSPTSPCGQADAPPRRRSEACQAAASRMMQDTAGSGLAVCSTRLAIEKGPVQANRRRSI